MENIRSQHENLWYSGRNENIWEAENRELQRLFVSMERDTVTVSHLDTAFFSFASENSSVQSYFIYYNETNSTNIITLLKNSYWEMTEKTDISETLTLPENPEITHTLQSSQKAVENIFANLQQIQNSLHNSTNLTTASIDGVVSLFSDDTVFQAYRSQFEFAQSHGKNILRTLQTIDTNFLNVSQKEQYHLLLQILHILFALRLVRTGFMQMFKNEIYAIPNTLHLMAYAIKGIWIGVYEWVKTIITSAADLAIFLWKYSFSSQYRTQINEQAQQIRNIIDEHGFSHISDRIFQELDKEMTRISGLPQHQQAQAIGNLTGHILAFVGVAGWAVKVVTRAEKLWKLSTLSTLKKMEKISLYTFDVLLSWIAETAIIKGISASYRWVKATTRKYFTCTHRKNTYTRYRACKYSVTQLTGSWGNANTRKIYRRVEVSKTNIWKAWTGKRSSKAVSGADAKNWCKTCSTEKYFCIFGRYSTTNTFSGKSEKYRQYWKTSSVTWSVVSTKRVFKGFTGELITQRQITMMMRRN